MALHILTANRLSDGRVVWYREDGTWSEVAENLLVAQDENGTSQLKAVAEQALKANQVVDANLIDVELREKDCHLQRLRERIRKSGPTIDYQINKKSA